MLNLLEFGEFVGNCGKSGHEITSRTSITLSQWWKIKRISFRI